MPEIPFEELKRYMRFGLADEAALRSFSPLAAPHFRRIADEFYARLSEHPRARAVLSGPEQVERLKGSLCDWMELLFRGPWDDVYFEKRARIGRVHVTIGLPQHYMFGAMDVLRISFIDVAFAALPDGDARRNAVTAIHKILDLELAIMLESYREAFVEKVQHPVRQERDTLQRQLAVAEARYDEIVEKAEALIVTVDRDGRILLFNRKCERVTGMPRDEAQGASWVEVFVQPGDRAAVEAGHRAVLGGGSYPPYEGPVGSRSGAGRLVRWHFTTFPAGPEPILCAIGLDVTDAHELAVRTQRAERLASLGTMAAGLAHEIRNPLNAAHLQLNVARRRLVRQPAPDPDGAQSAVILADGEINRLATLVEEFLQFARPQPPRPALLDLRATAQVTVALLEPEAAATGVELLLLPGPPVTAEFDDEKMKQVLLNLLRNAIEAAGQGGHVRVVVAADGASVTLAVEDDGPGLASEAPIFEPFYTTKEQGTGLGLAVVHRIVTDHGGSVEVQSRPGRTVFTVALPAAAGGLESGHLRPRPWA